MSEKKIPFPTSHWGKFQSIEELCQAPLQDGRFSVVVDDGLFESIYWPKPGSKRLYVLLSGARDLKSKPWPNFDRWSWGAMFPGSALCISDPTLSIDTSKLRIGWYVGTAQRDWTQAMADLVRRIALHTGVATRDIVCYGSSAGGFGAMTLASRLGDATAVAINPQTDVLKYHVRPVRQFVKIAFPPNLSKDTLTADQKTRLSAAHAMQRAPNAKYLLVQNRKDAHHYQEHFLPVAQTFDVDPKQSSRKHDRIWTMLYDGTSKHGPEPKSMVSAIVAAAEELCRTQAAPGAAQSETVADHATPASETLNIRSEFRDGRLVALADMPQCSEYAFYLYKGKERVFIQKYSDSSTFDWSFSGTPGVYRIKAYAKRPDGSTISGYGPAIRLERELAS